jgi:hypothetical protein
MSGVPFWLRKALVDFIETGAATLLALTFAIPTTLDQSKQVALLAGAALAGALIAAARRAFPEAIVWLKEKLGTT